ncbi:hypothetical protein [Natronosalvus caseinilyticus]|uniref:hypothetical protein n=1 Tax=Natronosalvus caseinilyticus TaxID=2953747 RepID=UPI0028AFA068|nr:hypothetical protein [Natronosalvus caseinilyticus]
MEKNNPTRRKMLKMVGMSSALGATGTVAGYEGDERETTTLSMEGSDIESLTLDEPEWTVTNTNKYGGITIALTVGYFGSQPQERWVPDPMRQETRYAHFFEASMCATCTTSSGRTCYDISNQAFDTLFYGGSENNVTPVAAATAWPEPSGGNWDSAYEALVDEVVGAVSDIASVYYGTQAVLDAYDEVPFDTNARDQIVFEQPYSFTSRYQANHQVNFQADQIPGSDGMVDILSVVSRDTMWSNSTVVYVYPDSDDIGNVSPNPSTYNTTSETMIDAYDRMSDKELKDHNLKRIYPSEVPEKVRRNTPFELTPGKPTYVTSFDMDVALADKRREEFYQDF